MLLIDNLKSCEEYTKIIDCIDFNHFDRSMFLYEHRKKSDCIQEIYNFVHSYENDETHKTNENEVTMLELVNQTSNISVKCLLMENLLYRKKYVPIFMDLAKMSIFELLEFLPVANTFAPSNRVEHLIDSINANLSVQSTKNILNDIFVKIKSMSRHMNKYLARVFYKLVTMLQEKSCTSKAHFDFTKELLSFALSNKPKNLSEFEIFDRIFDFAKTYTKPKKDIALQHADYIYSNLDIMHNIIRQSELEKAVKYLSEYSRNKSLINQYKIELDNANKEVLSTMQTHLIPLGKDLVSMFEKYNKMIKAKFQDMSSFKQVIYLIMNLKIITIEEIAQQAEYLRKKSFAINIIPVVLVDPKYGKVIKADNPTELVTVIMAFDIIIESYIKPFIVGFLDVFQMSREVEAFIGEMLNNNPICRPSKVNTVKDAIVGVFTNKFSIHLSNLISTFEDGIRYFLENSGVSTTEFVRGNQTKIDMNDIFRDEQDNEYKDKLLEFLTDDMFGLIQLLSVGSKGYNIRNKVMHGDFEDDDYRSLSAIYLSFLIVLCYFGFYCNIDSN